MREDNQTFCDPGSIKRSNPISTNFYSKPLIFITFGAFLALFAFISAVEGSNAKSNEIDVDWTLGTTTGSNNSNLTKQQQNKYSSSSILHPKVLTKYLFLKDVLRFHCPTDNHLAIHLVPAESAILCHLPEQQNGLAPIGFCGPNSGSDPRLIIRRYSPLPGKPSFREGNAYFFISTSNGSPNGTSQTSGGLCRTEGLRLRVIILPSPSNNAPLIRPADEWTDLAHLLMPIIIPTSFPSSETLTTTTTTISPPKASALSSNNNPVFPAILSLEQGGQRHKVLVHSQQELTEQLNAVSTNGGQKVKNEEERDVDDDSDENRGQRRNMGFEEENRKNNQKQDSSLYELMDGKTNKWPNSVNRLSQIENFEESKEEEEEERHLRRRRPVPKTARSPDPLVESQKLVYIIGYDGNGSGGGGTITF
uniref:Ephrin RBD domain-containing protein n=1 Tax=Meloidogyne floridensis TaxID=298350 RepID=A0A915NRC5_9BILA